MDERVVLYLSAKADVPQWIRILPMGEVSLGDGRQPFRVNRPALESILSAWEKRGNDLVIDYEHQSLDKEIAPAAGWIKILEPRDDGLWARVDWTERAQNFISSREYRYLSPVITLNKETRQPLELLNAALTNCPAINHQTPLTARLELEEGDKKEAESGKENLTIINQVVEEKKIMIDKIKVLLGLDLKAADQKVLESIETLKLGRSDNFGEIDNIAQVLGLEVGTSAAKIIGRLEALKVEVNAGHESRAELVRLQEQTAKEKAASMIQEALNTGRTSMEELARGGGKLKDLAFQDPEFFRVLILGRPEYAVVPLSQLRMEEEDQNHQSLNEDEFILCQAVGINQEQFRQAKRGH